MKREPVLSGLLRHHPPTAFRTVFEHVGTDLTVVVIVLGTLRGALLAGTGAGFGEFRAMNRTCIDARSATSRQRRIHRAIPSPFSAHWSAHHSQS